LYKEWLHASAANFSYHSDWSTLSCVAVLLAIEISAFISQGRIFAGAVLGLLLEAEFE
jgi:hypothetical protein